MLNLLNEISESPGIMGTCVFSAEHGIMASNLPARINPGSQKKVGALLQKIFSLDDTTQRDINSVEIEYEKTLILARKLDNSTTLFSFCQPDANLSMVTMSVNMLGDDLLQSVNNWQEENGTQGTDNAPQPEPAAKPVAPAQTYAEVINGPLADDIEQINTLLTKAIGPFAGIVLEDGINDWLDAGNSQREDLMELIQILSKDIEEEATRQSFIADLTQRFS